MNTQPLNRKNYFDFHAESIRDDKSRNKLVKRDIVVHVSLEDHLEEVCPRCGKEHESKWDLEVVEERHHYFKLTCVDCKYVIFRKVDFVLHDIEHLPKDSKAWQKNPYSLLGF